MVTYNTSDFKKGLKVQIDGDPYVMIECNFTKPGKGQAVYKTKLRHLLKGSVLDRTFRSGDSLEGADVEETNMQYLYQNGDSYVFMHPETFEQPELTAEQIGDDARWLKDGIMCQVILYNGYPIAMTPPNHMELEVTYSEPGAKGNTATNVTKPATVETGAEVQVPIFINQGDTIKVDTRTGSYIERIKK